jgi:hypothetical protein
MFIPALFDIGSEARLNFPMTQKHVFSFRALGVSCLAFGLMSASLPAAAQTFVEKKRVTLTADGPDEGKSAYKLIKKAFGDKAIESPDLYKPNHRAAPHITEDTDDVVGPHFVFLSHRDVDKDRDKDTTDRQRNEIKTYEGSKRRLKAFKGDTVQYRWKFKIDEGFEFSKSFTHFFQIKAKNLSKWSHSKDSDTYPVVTFTAVDKGDGTDEFQLRHSPSLLEGRRRPKHTKLVTTDMGQFTGQWVEFLVQATFADAGQLVVKATNIETGETLIDFEKSGIDMWRGENGLDFSRPKWGIYRSLKDKDSLRAEEEKARFADFEILKGIVE